MEAATNVVAEQKTQVFGLNKTNFLKFFMFPKGRFTVLNIAFLGLLLGINIVVSQYLKIPIPLFSIRFDHIWPMVVPLIYGFGLGLVFNVMSDALNQLISGQIGFYMWQYLLSMVFITLIVSVMRMVFYMKDRKFYNKGLLVFNNAFILAVAGALIAVLIVYNNGITVQQQSGQQDLVATILSYKPAFFWTGIGLTAGATLAALITTNWKYHKLKRRKDAVSAIYVLAIVFTVIVFVDVIWEGYAYQQYLEYVRRSPLAKYPYFYFLAYRIPEKVLIGIVSYIVVEAVYNVSRFLIKDKNERLTY